jgi:hypothetical protein
VGGATLADMPTRRYRLTVQGELSDMLKPAFPGMTLTRSAGNTALTGDIRDHRPSSKASSSASPASGSPCWKLRRLTTFPVAGLAPKGTGDEAHADRVPRGASPTKQASAPPGSWGPEAAGALVADCGGCREPWVQS